MGESGKMEHPIYSQTGSGVMNMAIPLSAFLNLTKHHHQPMPCTQAVFLFYKITRNFFGISSLQTFTLARKKKKKIMQIFLHNFLTMC